LCWKFRRGSACLAFQYFHPQNVTAIATIDGYCNAGECNIEQVWNVADGTGADAYDAVFNLRFSLVDVMRWFSPFAVIRAATTRPSIETSNYGGNIAWNTKYMFFRKSPNVTRHNDFEKKLFWTPNLVGTLPVLAIIVGWNKTCEQA
jgi:hypothetical protein